MEDNLRSVDFAEVHIGDGIQVAKTRLKGLARYENGAARWVGARLIAKLQAGEGEDKARKADAVRLFLGLVEFYADIHVLKALSNRPDGG